MAESVRVATYNTELSREGPGLLLHDIGRGNDPQIQAVVSVVTKIAPDILVLQGVDYDHGLFALTALRDEIAASGITYPYIFALPPNAGQPTGADLDGDGRLSEPEDRQAYGRFSGQDGMAILSRFPIETDEVKDFSNLLWRDLPNAMYPQPEDIPSHAGFQRLSRTGHWVVPIRVNTTKLSLLTYHATPPAFDRKGDQNKRRNHDETAFWAAYFDGKFGEVPQKNFILVGDANLDPADGGGYRKAISSLLNDSRLQDPRPRRSDPPNEPQDKAGDMWTDTVAWPLPDPGHRRVSYVLPSVDIEVAASGVYWPAEQTDEAAVVAAASRHRMVWVDLILR